MDETTTTTTEHAQSPVQREQNGTISGQNLAILRKAVGMNQEEFAQVLDMSRRTLVSIEQSSAIPLQIQLLVAQKFPDVWQNIEQYSALTAQKPSAHIQKHSSPIASTAQNEGIPGRLFRIMRVFRGISYQKVAETARVTVQHVQQCEETHCDVLVFEAFAQLSGITPDMVLSEIAWAFEHYERGVQDELAQLRKELAQAPKQQVTQGNTIEDKVRGVKEDLKERLPNGQGSLSKTEYQEYITTLTELRLHKERYAELLKKAYVTYVLESKAHTFTHDVLEEYREKFSAVCDELIAQTGIEDASEWAGLIDHPEAYHKIGGFSFAGTMGHSLPLMYAQEFSRELKVLGIDTNSLSPNLAMYTKGSSTYKVQLP